MESYDIQSLFFDIGYRVSCSSLSKKICRDHESAAIEGLVPEPEGRILKEPEERLSKEGAYQAIPLPSDHEQW
jgi:hypothetical protein